LPSLTLPERVSRHTQRTKTVTGLDPIRELSHKKIETLNCTCGRGAGRARRLWLSSAMGPEAAVAGTVASAAIVVLLLAGCSWCVNTRKSHHCGSIVVHVLVCMFDHVRVPCSSCMQFRSACVSRTGTELRPRNLARLCPSARLAGHAESISGRENRTGLSHTTRRTVAFAPLVVVFCSGDGAHHGPSEGARVWSYTSDAWPAHLAAPASELGSLILALDSGARLFCSTRA